MVEITREGLFTLDSAIVYKAVFHCLPYTTLHPISFLGVVYICLSVFLSACLPACLPACVSVCLPVCLMWWREQTLVIMQGYMCTYILFFMNLTFIFGPFTSSFVFCLLCLKFCFRKGSFLYCLLPFAFQLSAFSFCLLCLNFYILYFGFGFSHASSMIKRHLSTSSNFSSRQSYRQTDRHTDRQTIDSLSDMGRLWK